MARVPVSAHPFVRLTSDVVIEAVEQLGLHSDGRILALNSYENRVYQIGIDDGEPLVAKFYRPGRWSVPTILEEHEFAYELTAAEIPVVAPIEQRGRTLIECEGFHYCVYPRRGRRWPELVETLRAEIKASPAKVDHPALWLQIGQLCQQKLGDLEEARKSFEEALRIDT